jgi:hypothetical protein
MSIHAVENVLWRIGNDPREASKFIENSEFYLAAFRLEDDEKQLLRDMEVGRLAQRGANTLLLISAFRAVHGPRAIPEYMARMNGVPQHG